MFWIAEQRYQFKLFKAAGGGGRRRSSLRLAQGCARGAGGGQLGLLLKAAAVDSRADVEDHRHRPSRRKTEGVSRSI